MLTFTEGRGETVSINIKELLPVVSRTSYLGN